MRKLALVLALLLAAPAMPARAAEDLTARLAAVADQALREEDVVGIVIGAGRAGQPAVIVASGLADLETRRPLTPESPWKIASIGKTFTAALALELEEEGKLGLDDKLARLVPDAPNGGRVSLRQLLTHRSGYDDYLTDSFVAAAHARGGKPWTARELLAYARPAHLRFAPGSRYDYSNTNYLLLDLALEAAGGASMARQIRVRFLDPLGLKHSWIGAGEAVPAAALAHGYGDPGRKGRKEDLTGEPVELGGPDGAMVSSAGDLLAWAQALYGGRVLPPKRLAEMLSFPAPEPESGGSAYGLGVERMQVDRVYFYGHTGSAPGYNSALLYEPVTRMAIVIAINDDPADEALLDILIERVVRAVEGGGAVGFPRSAPAAQSDSE